MRHDLTTLNLVLAIEQTRSITRGAAQEHLVNVACRVARSERARVAERRGAGDDGAWYARHGHAPLVTI